MYPHRHSHGNRPPRGFTLIEVMIVVAIIAILAAIAYPSYLEQVRKSRRSDAKASLMEVAQQIERAYTLSNSYATAVASIVGTGIPSRESHYQIVVIGAPTASDYTIEAQPQGGQANDKCKNFRLTSAGVKSNNGGSITNPALCW